jgi:hypothetical protein
MKWRYLTNNPGDTKEYEWMVSNDKSFETARNSMQRAEASWTSSVEAGCK